jgi:import inner membrane translocase subunit TIM22
MNIGSPRRIGQVPIYPAGKEPLPPGFTEDDRAALEQSRKWESYMLMGMESCIVKTIMAGGGGVSFFPSFDSGFS